MASSTPLFFLLLSLCFLLSVTSIPEPELESSLTALRSKSYNLFGNAITTSDLRYEVLSGSSFTFFAPLDRALFSLDMTAPASVYVATLRYHVVPHRLSLSDLQSLPRSTLETMLPMHRLTLVTTNTSTGFGGNVSVDGVEVVVPGLYYGSNIAVHGLNGILNHRSAKPPTDPPEVTSTAPQFQPLIINRPQAPRFASPAPQPIALNGIPSGSASPVQLQIPQDSTPATSQPATATDRITPESPAFTPSPSLSSVRGSMPIYQGPVPGLVNEMGRYSEWDSGCDDVGPSFANMPSAENKPDGTDF